MEKGEQCSKRVWGGRGQSWQCQNKAVVEQDGKHYCKVHSPEYLAEKKRKWEEQYKEERAAKESKWAREAVIRKVCEGLDTATLNKLTPNLLKAAPQLYEALEKVRQDINWMLNNQQFLNDHCFEYIDKALASAEGK